jgi:hypothetical protein
MSDLVTLDEVKSALGVDPTDTRKDDQYTLSIAWASDAIRGYTERDLGRAVVTEQREFEYDGSGYLDIDDAQTITAVSLATYGFADYNFALDQWVAMPSKRDDAPVYHYLILPGGYYPGSPEMGFERNLDRIAAEGRLPQRPQTVKVTGTWGWPNVPGDVKLAAIWTIQDWVSRPGGDQLTAEAIEGYSRSWGGRSGETIPLAIPNRARDLLVRYVKPQV